MARPPTTASAEALAWLKSRVPMTDDAWRRLSAEHRRQAFRISGVNSAHVLGGVLRALERAEKRGTPFETFKRSVGPALRREWGGDVKNPTERMRTLFLTTAATALNHGRWEQMTQPEALRRRPFFCFVAVDDGKTTPVCRRCRRVVLPATHPFWRRRWPPLHFRCRSMVRAMTLKMAQRYGISTRAPAVPVSDGFGQAPERPWTPDVGRLHPLLQRRWREHLAELERRAA